MKVGSPLFILLAILLLTHSARAQTLDTIAYRNRYAEIEQLVKEEKFERANDLYLKQIASLREAGKIDSLYTFCYYFPKVIYELKGADAALEVANKLVNEVEQKDSDKRNHLTAINDLSWLYYEFGRIDKSLETDLRYLDKVNGFEGRTPRQVYVANFNVAADYQNIGNAVKAIEYYEKSVIPIKNDTLTFANELVTAYNGLGAALFRKGEFTKAKANLERSLKANIAIVDSADRYFNEANAYGNLALIYEEEGNLVKAKNYLEKSLEARRAGLALPIEAYIRLDQRKNLIRNYHNLSGLYLRIGDINRSRKVQEFAQSMRHELLDKDHVDHFKSLESFGAIEMALGNYEKAKGMFAQYKELCLKSFGENSYYTCTSNLRLGSAAAWLESWEEASVFYTDAIRIGKNISGEFTGQELAKAYIDRSECFRKMGEFHRAEQDVYRYLEISRKTRLETDPFLARGYNALAEIKLAAEDLDSANYFCDQAIRIVEEHIRRRETQNRRYDQFTFTLPESYLLKAKIGLAQGNDLEYLTAAAESLSEAIRVIQLQKRMLEGGASQIVLIDRLVEVYNLAQAVYFDLWKISKNDQYLDEMLRIAEQSKSTLLRGQLNRFTSLRVAEMPDSLAALENRLLLELSGQNDSQDQNRDDYQIEKEFNALIEEIAKTYPDYYRLRYEDFTAYPDTIQSVLTAEGANILEYTITPDRAFGFLINQNGMKVIELPTSGLTELLNSFHEAVFRRDDTASDLGHDLYIRLWKPFEPYFVGDEIQVIPHQALFQINFEALIKNKVLENPRYLIEDYTISYLLSATTALQFKILGKSKTNKVLALAPGFSDDLKQSYLTSRIDTTGFDDQYAQFIQQPFAVSTAQGLGSFFDTQLFVGGQATEENFKSEAEKYAIIHLGTHTEINNLSPLLSRLVLAKSNGESSEDGYLHAYEIYNLSLRAELAVLTACETGLGKSSSSEGMLSLAHSFAYAGCPSVLMSLWQIDEKSAATITESFYRYLAKGFPKNKALRQAKLDFLHSQSGELSKPYYWSGMVLLGDVSPISDSGIDWWWYAILVVVAIATAILIMRRRKTGSVS